MESQTEGSDRTPSVYERCRAIDNRPFSVFPGLTVRMALFCFGSAMIISQFISTVTDSQASNKQSVSMSRGASVQTNTSWDF